MNREKKEIIIKDLREKIKNSNIVVFLNFHGLNLASLNILRKKIKQSGAIYKVAKKTLVEKALSAFDFEGQKPVLDGELALAFGKEETALPKIINDFIKAHIAKGDDKTKILRILGGMLENRFIDYGGVNTLAKIPSREIILVKLMGALISPKQQMVGVLGGVMRGFVNVLNQIKINK